MLTEDWLVLLNAAGTVIGIDGGAPADWVSRPIKGCVEMPDKVRREAERLLADVRHPMRPAAIRRRRIAPAEPDAPSFTLLAIEAIPLWSEEIELMPMLYRLLSPMRQQAASMNVPLSITCKGTSPILVTADVTKIGWAVTTLVGSALRHVRRGTGATLGGRVDVHVTQSTYQGLVSITVQDDGPGISESIQPWLFEPDPETGRSVGVALLMVHQVVVAHGGGVVVKSSTEPSKQGTAITLCLPTRRLA